MSTVNPVGAAMPAAEVSGVETEAYEPTYIDYAEAFPALVTKAQGAGLGPAPGMQRPSMAAAAAVPSKWNNTKMSLRSTTLTQVFCVPLEERRYKDMVEQQFGEKGGQQAKSCVDIMQRTGVSIEMSSSKDQSLTVVITGKSDAVMRARKMVVQQLQTQAKLRISIPKEHHRFILGPKGKKLQDLELATATKISVPRQEENFDYLTITGTKDGLEKARHELQCISDEQAKLAFERLPIPKIYHPFVCGPDNVTTKTLMEQTGARISVPPPSVPKDEIVVAGEKEGVFTCKQTIMAIYEEKKRRCQTVSVEVRKSQHKYVIGPRGSNLSEILGETGVSVEVPPLDSGSETITLRGEQDKLGPALTLVYSKANSVVIEEVEAPAWLHRFIIGKKGANVRKITQNLPKVHIEFTDGQDKIVVEGPPEEVQEAKKELSDMTKDLMVRMAFAEIDIDQKYHRHIIGRQGANVTRIKNDTGVSIRIPSDTEHSNVIRIEGSPEGVAQAKKELVEMVHKMENEKSRDILIEHRFHRTMIGSQGSKIREVRDLFPEVQINFPDPSKKSDVVTLRGPKNEVDKCHKYMQQLNLELVANNFQVDVHIFKKFHKNIIGKGGSNIRKIREETDTRIDLPTENSDSDVIVITGRKDNALKARDKIEAIQKELANISELMIEIPHKHHNSIIGSKGRLIRSIMDECGGVLIRFPSEGSVSDKVVIRGPKEDVDKAKKQLLELAVERKESSFSSELKAKPEYHKFLIGRGGTNIREVRERTGARIIFPTSNDTDQEMITIIGRQDSVESAKKELEIRIKELDSITEGEISVDPKHHRHFVARRGEVLKHIADEYGGVTVSFPRSGVKSDRVVIKGAKECVEGAKRRILEIVSDLDSQVTIDCVIPQKYHRTVMGSKGHKVQEITRGHEVGIKFPDRPTENTERSTENTDRPTENTDRPMENAEPQENGEQPLVNGDVESESSEGSQSAPKKQDVIIITGRRDHCEAARDALLALVPITDEVAVPYDFHRYIIGKNGRDVRKMMEDFDVNIAIPPADDHSDLVRITGPRANVTDATGALAEKVKQLEAEQEDRKLRSHQLEVEVEPKYHPKIIGRGGTVISRIRLNHDVQIQFPEKSAEKQDIIMVTGYVKNAEAAKNEILSLVAELEDMITEPVHLDYRIHSRLIGGRGRAIRKVMDDYKVDIKFPTRGAEDPNIVEITGQEDNVLDCKDYLLNQTEEYMQDINERELMSQYMHPPSRGNEPDPRHGPAKGYVVRGAPWEGSGTLDTNSTADFPDLGMAVQSPPPTGGSSSSVKWGPPVKR